MKKSTLLLMASALLFPGLSVAKDVKPFDGNVPTQKISSQKIINNSLKRDQLQELVAKSPARNSEAQTAVEFGDIIYEAPAGETKTMARSGEATYAYWGMLVGITYNNQISELVVGDDGYVYIKNPISQYSSGTYLKGKQEGNKVVFELPQAISAMDYNGEEIYMLVSMLQYSEEEDWYYPCNTPKGDELGFSRIDNQFVVNINEDGSYTMDIDEGRTLIPGMIYSDNLSWTGYSELASEWKKFTDTLNPGPAEGANVEDVFVLYGGIGHYAKMAIDGDDVFVQGIFPAQPESWIQGKREDNKISFPSGQYVGEDLNYGCYTYFVATTFDELWDEYYEEWYNYYYYADKLTFNYDEATQTLTSGENEAILYNSSDKQITYLQAFVSPVIEKQPAEISQTPQNPYDLQFYDYMEDYGYSWLSFHLPMFNVDNVLLDANDLCYKIYVDDLEMEFTTDDYLGIDDEMILVPYFFTEDYDFIVSETYHEVYVYFDGADTIGVQLCSVKDGEIVGESDIVSINISTGIKNVAEANSNRVVSTKYFNMNGQEVSNPAQGIFVKSVRYEDGSVKSFKEMRK